MEEIVKFGPDCSARELAHVAASLAEGFCPAGHRLAVGNGRFGTCHACQMTWTAYEHGYRWGSISGPDLQTTHVRMMQP